MQKNDAGATTTGVVAVTLALILGLLGGYLVWGSPEQITPTSQQSAPDTQERCNEWDDTSLGKHFSMRARSCGIAVNGTVIAQPEVQVDEEWGDAFHYFHVVSTIRSGGSVVATRTCDHTKAANNGTNGSAFGWDDEYLTCALETPATIGWTYEVKVDVTYDQKGDFGAGEHTAEDADPVSVNG